MTETNLTEEKKAKAYKIVSALEKKYYKLETKQDIENIYSELQNNGFSKEQIDYAFEESGIDLDKSHDDPFLINVYWDKDIDTIKLIPVEWLAEEIFPRGSINFLGGKRGAFKTLAALHMAFVMANGLPIFNHFQTRPCKVLYIDEENGISLIKKRSDMIKKGLGIKSGSNVGFISYSNLKLDSKEWLESLKAILKEHHPDVIFVDSLRRVVRLEESDAGQVSTLFTDIIRPLSNKYDLTWVFLHHMRKGISGRNPTDEMDEMRGSSELTNYADTVMVLQRNRGSNDSVILKQVKNRYKQEISGKVIQLDWTDGLKMACVGDAENTLVAVDICAKEIISWMAENEISSFKAKDCKDAMRLHHAIATINRALKQLKDRGELRSLKRGCYEIVLNVKLGDYTPKKDESTKNE